MVDPSGMRAAEAEYARQMAEAANGGFIENALNGNWGAMDLDDLQEAVGLLGVIPVIGDALDIVNGIVYAARGKWDEAAWSLLAIVPLVGSAAPARHLARYADEAVAAGRRLMARGDEIFEGVRAVFRTSDEFATGVARGGATPI